MNSKTENRVYQLEKQNSISKEKEVNDVVKDKTSRTDIAIIIRF